MRRIITCKIKPHSHVDFIGDFHIGAIGFREDLFDEYIRGVKKDKKRYIVLMGDIFDMILTRDKRRNEFEVHPEHRIINKAYNYLLDRLYPVRKQVLGCLFGNHEVPLITQGVDILAGKLDIPAKKSERYRLGLCNALGCQFLGSESTIAFKIGSHKCHVFAMHGHTSSRTRQGRVNAAKKKLGENSLVIDEDYDFCGVQGIFYAHTHDTYVTRTEPQSVADFKNNQIAYRDQIIALTGTFLDSQVDQHSYGARGGYSPMPAGYVEAIFDDRNLIDARAHTYSCRLVF